jgi:hypothetical protein
MQQLLAKQNAVKKSTMSTWRRIALILIVVADAGLLAWGAMAAIAPERLPGPDATLILPAEYEGVTHHTWSELMATSPLTAEFITILFRVYGAYIVAFGVLALSIAAIPFRRGESWAWWALLIGNTIAYSSAMLYDRAVGAIGPLELSEYLGLGAIYLALAITAPFFGARRSDRFEAEAA